MRNIQKIDTDIHETSIHEPVLLQEVVQGLTTSELVTSELVTSKLVTSSNIWYLDGTLGGAGHAKAIVEALKGKINVIGLDQDENAIARARKTLDGRLQKGCKLILERANFRDLGTVLKNNDVHAVDMILLDLGISSDELENSGQGFSFLKDEPLVMTMGNPSKYSFTAADIVNNWSEESIADIVFGYGEERYARCIARNIMNYRSKKKIETTFELAEIVKMSLPKHLRSSAGMRGRKRIHPATKTFQALRIAVNDELNALKEGLESGYRSLIKGGRMAVISFHSLEDRIVKNFYKESALSGAKIITKKPIAASDQELAENHRSRSAKLRIIEK